MARGMPSMTALLALLAVAGYQNRDKLAAMLGGNKAAPGAPGTAPQPGEGSIFGNVSGSLGAGGIGGMLGSGLQELLDRFHENGKGDVARSWVGTGPNQPIAPPELETALGPDLVAELAQRTGLSRDQLLQRLSTELPSAVDKYTPGGQLPAAA